MDWSAVIQIATKLAPALGLIPGGGVLATVATTVGPMLAEALGVEPTPQAVAGAIAADPDGAAKNIGAVVNARAADIGAAVAEAQAREIAAVNETARAELLNESRFVRFARPANVWAVAIVTLGYGLSLVAATGFAVAGNPVALNLLVANAGVLGVMLAPAGAVAGIAAWGRTREKLAVVPDGLPSLAGAAVEAAKIIRGRK